jgi:hypothetical protein
LSELPNKSACTAQHSTTFRTPCADRQRRRVADTVNRLLPVRPEGCPRRRGAAVDVVGVAGAPGALRRRRSVDPNPDRLPDAARPAGLVNPTGRVPGRSACRAGLVTRSWPAPRSCCTGLTLWVTSCCNVRTRRARAPLAREVNSRRGPCGPLSQLDVVVEVKLIGFREAREPQHVVFVHLANTTSVSEWVELSEFRERWEPALWVTLWAKRTTSWQQRNWAYKALPLSQESEGF